MTVALENLLAEAGLKVSADEFLRIVANATRKVSPPHPNPSDYFSETQQQLLSDVGLDLSPYRADEPDPRAGTVATQAVMTESAHSVADAANVLGIDASRVRHKLKDGQLIGWKDRGWHLPAWQFEDGAVVPGLAAVLRAIPDDQPQLVIAAFMNTPQPDLEINGKPVTPRQWLLAHGDPRPVADLAATLGTAP